MNDFTRKLITEWRRLELPFAGETVVVAISGGADSVALALALHELQAGKKLRLRFVLAHFNHALRGEESGSDEQFVKEFAEKFDFELAAGKGEISKDENLEQSARKARYDFLTATAENLKARSVLTAHTANDQAETFLINLIRGSGLEGLGAMKTKRNLSENGDVRLIRPLLSWAKRSDTENFCRLNEIEYRFDSMNEDLAFRRVRIRKVLLPMLEDFNPRIVENLSRTAFHLQNDFEELEKIRGGKRIGFEPEITGDLNLKILKDLTASEKNDLIRRWLKKRRGDLRALDAKHFAAIQCLAESRKSGRTVELPNGESVMKRGGKLLFEERKVEK